MKSLYIRLMLTCGAVGLLGVLATALQASFNVSIREPKVALEAMSNDLGSWHGEDIPLDADLARFIGAKSQISRQYQDSSGAFVALYVAVWSDESVVEDISPHPPTICYPAAGWTIANEKEVVLETRHGKLPVQLLEMTRADRRIVTAHWFQLGEARYGDRQTGRLMLSRYWGEKEWPPLVKVLLQTEAQNIAEAETRLLELAELLDDYTGQIN
ncbi:exosortase C-terminal domain/associated protein EpsI [Blastopirellula marina]|uniref:EpsI family protein n=1 Tax=Blastopirellula marina TaxID=124 RepID=A0A2S8GHF8_9BACT|nr:exosortase C-terminal domain/associated protein EpsI [Blastopirellula marina]PQO43888.1 EpsI family protein [Blastopirellula marina]